MKLQRKTSFGSMTGFTNSHDLLGAFELMHFERDGKPHTHAAEEIAVCVGGCGYVVVGEERMLVGPGEAVRIPAGIKHHMEPDVGGPFTMMILYAA